MRKYKSFWILIGMLLVVSVIATACTKGYDKHIKNIANTNFSKEYIEETTSSNTSTFNPDPVEMCIELCQRAKQQGMDLSQGPCLSDIMDYNVSDYVCDVAHWPRQEVDNLAQNQCQEFRAGLKQHFVEVDENCKFIRKI